MTEVNMANARFLIGSHWGFALGLTRLPFSTYACKIAYVPTPGILRCSGSSLLYISIAYYMQKGGGGGVQKAPTPGILRCSGI